MSTDDATLVEIAQTLDFGDVNTKDRPLVVDVAMCKNLNVADEREEKDSGKNSKW